MIEEVYISAYCYSELAEVSISFGISLESEVDPIEAVGSDWIWVGMSESFWENYHEFEPYIEMVKEQLKNNSTLSHRQALTDVFGRFTVSYEVNGNESKLNFDLDTNEAMFALLEEAL